MRAAFRNNRMTSSSRRSGNEGLSLSASEKKSLTDALRSSVEAKTRGRKTPRRTLEDAFRELDIDKSETISSEEFVTGTSRFLQGVHPDKVRGLFASFDADGSGQLSVNEFIHALLDGGDLLKENNQASSSSSSSSSKVRFRRAADATSPKQIRQAAVPRNNNRSLQRTKATAPYFNEDRPELRPDASKIGTRSTSGAKSGKKPSSASERKRKHLAQKSIDQLRERIIERGGTTGIQSLARVMKIMDDSGDRKLSREELKYGLQDFGMPLSATELEDLFRAFDVDGSGSISFNEFLLRLANPMNASRVKLVDKAFQILDVTGDGVVTVEDVMEKYDVSLNPEVVAGKITQEEAFRTFLDAFDSGVKDGRVTRDEFHDYYRLISAAIDTDDYFELMLRNAWHMSGGKGQAMSTTCRRVLVTHVDGRQTVEEITDDLGIAADDTEEMKRNLLRRGIRAKSIQAYGAASSMSKKKKNKNGPFGREKEEARARERQDRTTIKRAPFATSEVEQRGSSRKSGSRGGSRGSRRESSSRESSGRRSNNNEQQQQQEQGTSLRPMPTLSQLNAVIIRCHRDVVERAKSASPEYRDQLMTRYDRMQYHLTELDERMGELMVRQASGRRSSKRGSSKRGSGALTLRDFGFIVRAFTYEGQTPIIDENLLLLWRGCSGGDVDVLCQKLFRPSREEKEVASDQSQTTESEFVRSAAQGQEEVGEGPFDRGHFGERVVSDRVLKSWPLRMRYKYSNTPVQAPTNFQSELIQRSAQRPSEAELELEWVYGNNGRCYDNTHVSSRGELVYHKAAVVVLHDTVQDKQRHFLYHDDDITCLDVDASGTLGASGQMGRNPRICVFDLHTLEVMAVVGGNGFFERSVCAVSFCSVDSGYLLGVGDDDHHSLGVFKWKLNKTELEGLTMHGMATTGQPSPGKLIADGATMNGEPPQIYGIVVPDRDEVVGGSSSSSSSSGGGSKKSVRTQRFATVGNSHTKFWTVDLNSSVATGTSPLTCRNSRYNGAGGGERMSTPRKTTCAAYCPDGVTLITGGSDGTLYVWDTRKGECLQTFQHHRTDQRSKVDVRMKSTQVQALSVMMPTSGGSGGGGSNRGGRGRGGASSAFTVVTGGVDGTVRRFVLSLASKGKKRYDVSEGVLVCSLGKEYRGMREAVRNSNMDEPDTIIAPRPSEHHLSFKAHAAGTERGDPSKGDQTGAGLDPANVSAGMKERARRRAEADAGLNGGASVLRARHAVTSLESINGVCYVSTRRGDVWTVDPSTMSVEQKVHSHFGPVYGLCPHPLLPTRFATIGEDRMLCIWEGHRQVCSQYLPTMARSCAYSPDGCHLALGCVNGAVLIYRFQKERKRAGVHASLIFHKVVQDCVEAIDDLKYSPDGTMLAVGSHDNFVDVYVVRQSKGMGMGGMMKSKKKKKSKQTSDEEAYVRISRCRGHTSYVTHVDWSKDSKVIQSNCGAYEIIYWDAETGRPILSSTDTVEADTDWATWTCVLGFPVMGVWPEYTDGTDVNSTHISSDGRHVVTGDDFGQIKLFNAPCVVHHAPPRTYGGHSSHVMNVRWLLGDGGVVSVGGWDEGVFLWNVAREGSNGGVGRKGRTEAWKPLTNFR